MSRWEEVSSRYLFFRETRSACDSRPYCSTGRIIFLCVAVRPARNVCLARSSAQSLPILQLDFRTKRVVPQRPNTAATTARSQCRLKPEGPGYSNQSDLLRASARMFFFSYRACKGPAADEVGFCDKELIYVSEKGPCSFSSANWGKAMHCETQRDEGEFFHPLSQRQVRAAIREVYKTHMCRWILVRESVAGS